MSHDYVTEIDLKDDGSLALTVWISGFEAGTPVEISGSATQTNGAMATFYDVQRLPAREPGGSAFLTVTAAPAGDFVAGEVITVVTRAAKIWGTVLSEDRGDLGPGIKARWKATPQD